MRSEASNRGAVEVPGLPGVVCEDAGWKSILADTAVEAHANGILQVIEIDGSAAPTLRDRLSRSGAPQYRHSRTVRRPVESSWLGADVRSEASNRGAEAVAFAETVGADEASDPTSLLSSENVASEAAAMAFLGGSLSFEKPGDGQLAAAASSEGGSAADADEVLDTELGTICFRPRGRAAVSALVAAIQESHARDGAGEACTSSGKPEREDERRDPRSEAAHVSTGARPRQCAGDVRLRQSERSRSRSRRRRAASALIAAIHGEEHVEVQAPARRADVQVLTHSLLASSTVTWCRICGAYADARTRGILRRCPGPPGRGGSGRTSLRRLLAGRHPRTNEVLPGRALSLRATF